MYITCKKSTANLRRIDSMIDSPDILTLSTVGCAELVAESGRLWIEAATDCLNAFHYVVLDKLNLCKTVKHS